MSNKIYECFVKFEAVTARNNYVITADCVLMVWESPETLYDEAEFEITGISLESFYSGSLVVNERQAEMIEAHIVNELEKVFFKTTFSYRLPDLNLETTE